jgi:anti-sigma regulatory factor (Ser/Thr protein kinase)
MSGYTAAGPAVPTSYGRLFASVADAARVAPFADGWPRQTFLELGALPSAVPCARLHARQLIWEWRLAALCDDVELLVSELVTNAVRASRSLQGPRPVRLWLLADAERILTLVWDACEEGPVRVNTDADLEGGRGLMLVEALSSRWDWYRTQETGGKIVWALVTRAGDGRGRVDER